MHYLVNNAGLQEKKVQLDTTITAGFERQVELAPDNPALKSAEKELTYRSLNRKANRLARRILQECGENRYKQDRAGRPNDRVALLFGHGIDMTVALLAILKTGKIYVPLDPAYPQERLVYILRDAAPRIILTGDSHLALTKKLTGLARVDMEILNINAPAEELSPENLSLAIEPEQAAYILYTSGSTGKPKGVVQTRQNIAVFIGGFIESLRINAGDRILLLTSYCHTVAAIDIFAALLSGAALCIYDIHEMNGIEKLSEWIRRAGVTFYHSVPTLYRHWLDLQKEKTPLAKIRCVALGGEEVTKHDVVLYKKHFSGDCILVNLFGSSEVLIAASHVLHKKSEVNRTSVPIGCPVAKVEIDLVDSEGEDVGILAEGEMVFKSDYLALGYWNLPEKTGEFFTYETSPEPRRTFRSGDLGRMLPDGSIEYLGRRDFQVKISGNRIELSEIEILLDNIAGIKKSTAAAFKKDNGENYLVAYYTTIKESDIEDKERLREYLQQKLPDYMIPAFFVFLEKFPLTPNGKIDRAALPEPESRPAQEYMAPRSLSEEKLAHIWSRVLDPTGGQSQAPAGIDDNFFTLGGDSFKAMTMAALIHKEFNVRITVGEIFKAATIRKLSARIKVPEEDIFTNINPSEKKEYYQLSPAQKRFYILQQVGENKTGLNLPQEIMLSEGVEIKRLQEAFGKLIARYEILRTSFEMINGKLVQRVHEKVNFAMEYCTPGKEQKTADFVRPFDLAKPPLLRARLIGASDKNPILSIDMHHITADKISQSILEQEFAAVYSGEELAPLKLHYKDYVTWQNSPAWQEVIKDQFSYWNNYFSGELPELNLPGDYSPTAGNSYEAEEYRFSLDKRLTLKLKKATGKKDVTPFMMLTAAYSLLLSRLARREDILIGVPVPGRNHDDLRKMAGMFVNIVVLRHFPLQDKRFTAFLNEVKENALAAFANGDYPFEMIFERMRFAKGLKENYIFNTVFNMPDIKKNPDSFKLAVKSGAGHSGKGSPGIRKKVSRYDITIYAHDLGETIGFFCNYRSTFFKKSTITYIMGEYRRLIGQVVENDNKLLKEYEIFN